MGAKFREGYDKLDLYLIEHYKPVRGNLIEIANIFNVHRDTVINRLKRLNIKQNNMRKYHFNEDFFKVWSNDMAYILGFIIADGYIHNKGVLTIRLSSRDVEILEFIKNKLELDCPIIYYSIKNKEYVRLDINSLIVFKDLLSLGLTQGKAHRLQIPSNLPRENIPSFIRGYFDGDGHVSMQAKTTLLHSNITSISIDFLSMIKSLCGDIGNIYTYKKLHYQPCSQLRMSHKQSLIFRDFIYQDGGFCLERKKKIFYSNRPYIRYKYKKWSEEEIEYVKSNYKTMSILDISAYLSRSCGAIRTMYCNLV